jgi:hypothetical protein
MAGTLGGIPIVFAHALSSRADLPIEPWVAAWGASLVLIISFFALAAGWTQPKLEGDHWRPVGAQGLSRVLLGLPAQILCGALGIFLLGVTVYAGYKGTSAPDRNLALTFVFVTVWLGFPLFSVLLGDIFRAFNPWRAMGRAAGGLFRTVARQEPVHLNYPEGLGRWPAAGGLVAFVWIEVVYGSGGGVSVGLSPSVTATAALVYTLYTLAMMTLFGTEKWCARGEFLSVYFGMYSQLAGVEARDGRLGVRRPLEAAGRWAMVPGSVAVVIASISTTTFDGAQEGVLKNAIQSTFEWFSDGSLIWGDGSAKLVNSLRVTDTLFLLGCVAAVGGVYLLGVWGMRSVGPPKRPVNLARAFAHSLIPIALAYVVAHYFSLFVFQEQAQFTYLLSDPLGTGATDLFGTATGGIDYRVIGASLIQYVQIGALITGHAVGLMMAHDRAVSLWGDARAATRSQYWMLAVMVSFTCLGIYLLMAGNQ